MKRFLRGILAACVGLAAGAAADTPRTGWQPEGPYPFGVLNQRSPVLTAEYWNPILGYLSRKTGARYELRIARTANETTDLAVRGELAFAFTNHLFTPKRDALGWTVLARPEGEPIRGQIVAPESSPVRSLSDLQGKRVVFPNPYAFVGYFVPFDALLQAGVEVIPEFVGNQEAAMGRLRAGEVAAAGVNHKVMATFARREHFPYRVLYESGPYLDLCIMAHPAVPPEKRAALRAVLAGMASDPEGRAVLEASARAIGAAKAEGFTEAADSDYDNYRAFFRSTRVPFDQ
jgi:phosphonate transport system substrate-binding protein